jgi:hypothetical protein
MADREHTDAQRRWERKKAKAEGREPAEWAKITRPVPEHHIGAFSPYLNKVMANDADLKADKLARSRVAQEKFRRAAGKPVRKFLTTEEEKKEAKRAWGQKFKKSDKGKAALQRVAARRLDNVIA